MNFTPHRVQPEQINLEDEAKHHRLAPPEYQTPEYHAKVLEAIRAGRITYAPGWNRPPEQIEHTDPPSVEDYHYTRLELACDCYRVQRNSGRTRWEALRHFFNALKGSV